jgi:protein Tex
MDSKHQYHHTIAKELKLNQKQVASVLELFEDGATIPFISRYRKEQTGSLDELQITAIRDRHGLLTDIAKRRQVITDSLEKRALLTPGIQSALVSATTIATLEDIYLPYKQKRKTRAMAARERGLEPLAKAIFQNHTTPPDITSFLNSERELHSVEDVFAGVRDIIAEWISEDASTRNSLRRLFSQKALVCSSVVKKQKESGTKYRDYFDWQEACKKAPGHRLLAMFRGETEKILRLTMRPDEPEALSILRQRFPARGKYANELKAAIEDGYKRLLCPSLEKELRTNLKEKAHIEAITVFADNLKELLVAPPLGRKNVMALDPGFRTGAKLVCLDSQGALLDFTTIYPTHGGVSAKEAGRTIEQLCNKYKIQAIAIGNGTAGRETEDFVRQLGLGADIIVTMVNESGASIYSASAVAREEFPNHDITVRGAVSIGRRLQDPLAELVKLDPKSIGVGQYQHDVNQNLLKQGLHDVVESCVNSVGVQINNASRELLNYVSGLGPVLADNIIQYRQENGPFTSRKELLKVKRLGAKAYEQCAGFMRIHGAKNPLDNSAVHPERYNVVKQMAKDLQCTVQELITNGDMRDRINLQSYVSVSLGIPTLRDIIAELAKPGRDPRATFNAFAFSPGINSMDDLIIEMKLPGIVTNVTKFGAFVDIGVHQDGLLHISQLADRFVKDPAEVVKVGQQLLVRVLEVDSKRKRISLSLRNAQ